MIVRAGGTAAINLLRTASTDVEFSLCCKALANCRVQTEIRAAVIRQVEERIQAGPNLTITL